MLILNKNKLVPVWGETKSEVALLSWWQLTFQLHGWTEIYIINQLQLSNYQLWIQVNGNFKEK